jgi:hypothetical protein
MFAGSILSRGQDGDVVDAKKLRELVADGASITSVARELGVSRYAARRAIERAGLQTARSQTLVAARAAREAGAERMRGRCVTHGDSPFFQDTRGTYRCTRCSMDAVARRRRKVKATLVAEAGGRCVMCGYDRCTAALAFHHLDPALKAFGLAEGGLARALSKSRQEAAKCVLLCANCHAEVEAGVSPLPLRLADDPR